MIRVLQDLFTLDGGGVAKLVYEYYRNMDHTQIQYDFVIYNLYEEGIYERPLEKMGCKIYKLPIYQQHPKECLRQMEQIVREGHYDAVHSHFGVGSFRMIYLAWKYHVPRRIVHSHIAYEPYSIKTSFNNVIKRQIIRAFATDYVACGEEAGAFMWGRGKMEQGRVYIMKNAIDTAHFQFSAETRKKKRNELGLGTEFVIGIVARLSAQKNYPFLFQVYEELLKKDDKTVLLVIGRGTEEKEIRTLAADIGLAERIRFLGVRDDVPELLNALDVFVLPSLYEGLPVALVEAQANGLPEIVSDRITDEMAVTDLIQFLPLEKPEFWAERILACQGTASDRSAYADIVRSSGYGIEEAALKMQEFYLKGAK